MTTWQDDDPAFIRDRYDRIARIMPLFDWLFCQPTGIRQRAVDRLDLRLGDCVLEIGCGHGRNLPALRSAVGSTGRVYGVDFSAGMLRAARHVCGRQGWTNVILTHGDAAAYESPEPVHGILFSLSYNTMPNHEAVLRRAWEQLRPGGSLVIFEAKAPPGRAGRLILPFSVWLMKRTVLGNPFVRPWDDLAALAQEVTMEEHRFGSYYICRGAKPVSVPASRPAMAAAGA